jgi:hypothetical protein
MYVVQGALLFVAKVLLRFIYRVGAEVAQSIQCLDNGLVTQILGYNVQEEQCVQTCYEGHLSIQGEFFRDGTAGT